MYQLILLFAERFFRLGVGLTSSILIARTLGAEQFGLISSDLAIRSIIIVLLSLGLESYVLRESSLKESSKLFSSHFLVRLVLNSLYLFVALVIFNLGDVDLATTVILISAFFNLFDVREIQFKAKKKVKELCIISIAIYSIVLAARIYGSYNKMGLDYFAYTYALEYILGLIAFFVYKRKDQKIIISYEVITLASQLFKQGGFLVASALSVIAFSKIDIIMLENIDGPSSAGIYSAATRISEMWFMIPAIIMSYLIPRIEGQAKKIFETEVFGMQITVALSYFFLIVVYFCSEPLITFLYGNDYIAASNILKIHAVASIFVSLGTSQAVFFYRNNLVWYSTVKNVVAVCCAIGLNYIFIPKYGAQGAAIATVLAFSVSTLIMNALNKRTNEIFIQNIRALLLLDIIEILNLLREKNVKSSC
ncbi:flippase [Photobacterium sp. GJ3]|uniref:flippase n=1 Tax=Photobacterium sp. GJ3 TaxID=2829502 RepID=UPI001B8CAA38|nr:flippase [Photobacterium sp. GJ3]QUJ68205.1 flippase [Photobacterium sp. GJ3]